MGETLTASAIAKVLHESCHIVLARALKVLGQERCIELLAAALTIEHEGGLMLKDGSRKRTLGGVFLALCKEHSTPEEKRRIFR